MTGVGFLLAILFMRIVDSKWRMPIFYFGAACYVLSALIPTVGFTQVGRSEVDGRGRPFPLLT